MGRSGDPRRRWGSTGIQVDVTTRYNANLVDPGPGQHLWTVLVLFAVTPTGSQAWHLDQENLLTIEGPGCFKCERSHSVALAAQSCTGSMH